MPKLTLIPALGLLALGCVGVPSPLSPGVEGSVGVPHHGVQTGALELPRAGEGFARYRPHGTRYWGLPRLVRAVERAAATVAQRMPEGEPLVVGDLSARHGGKISGHNSHRTGRDVDLLYYVTTPSGAPTRSPGFASLEGDALAFVPETGDFVRLDVARQWLLVRTLLTDAEIGVQFMFMSRDVEALLIDYALARGEPTELVYHAQTVMLQPGDSTPHADHMHLRIACTPQENVSGCSGGGPYWEWLPEASLPEPLDQDLLQRIASDDPPLALPLAESKSGGRDGA